MTTPSPSVSSRASRSVWAYFLAMSLIWGSSFFFIEVALADDVGAYTLAFLRTAFGAAFLAGVMLFRGGGRPGSARAWSRYAFLGLTNLAIPFLLITWAQLSITSGMASILNALVPLFTVILGSLILLDEPVTLNRITGLLIGFVGVVLLALPSLAGATVDADGMAVLLGMAAVGAASFSYAVGAVYARHRLADEPIMKTSDGSGRVPTVVEISFWQVLMGAVILFILAILIERTAGGAFALPATFDGWFALLWLGVLSTGVAYVLFFRVMGAWGPTRATMVTYVVPPIAILLGFVILDERLEPIELIGSALIIAGIVIVNSRPVGRVAVPGSGTA